MHVATMTSHPAVESVIEIYLILVQCFPSISFIRLAASPKVLKLAGSKHALTEMKGGWDALQHCEHASVCATCWEMCCGAGGEKPNRGRRPLLPVLSLW